VPLTPGSRLGAYEIAGLLGAGGMGEVWRARDTRLGRDVAIKALPEALAQEPERLARFEREAKLLASLNHPNIAGIHGLEESGGRRYLVLEFVDGVTLEERLKQGPLPVDDTLDIAAQIALALETAHESGIVHRDLKPGNVMLTPQGAAKVLDFGLAKGGEGSTSGSNLSVSPTIAHQATQEGVILGTAAYMSPEQARGKRVDRRTDIWSFGCVLFECLTGRQAFEGDTVSDLIAKILEREPNWDALPERTPPRVRGLLHRCLTKDPGQRLRDIGEARIALSGASAPSGSQVSGAPASRPRGFPWPWLVTGVVVAAAIALQALWPRGEPRPDPLWLGVTLPPDQPLDAGPEYNLVAISPDGMTVAFVARTEQDYRLFLRRLDGRAITELPGTEGARDPFFAPDGQWVGFLSGHNLKKVSINGGTPVDLAEVAADRGAVWAPDGSILFTPDYGSPLFRIPGSGGTPEPLTSLDSTRAERSHRWPDAIAGSEWVVFTVGTIDSPGGYDGCDIDAVSLRTGERRTVARGSFARFAPDGRLIVGRSGWLYAMPLDPRDPRPGGGEEPVLDGVQGQLTSGAVFFDVAENGTLAYVPGTSGTKRSRLAWMDLQGRPTPLPTDAMDLSKVVMAPDGAHALLEVGQGGGGTSDIWMLDLSDYTLSRLTFDGISSDPHMLSGGRFLWVVPTGLGSRFLTRSLDGSDSARVILDWPKQLTIVTGVTPDGREIVFNEYGKVDSDIWSLATDGGGEPERVVNDPMAQSGAKVSPDGRWVAYTSDETGASEVYVRPWRRAGSRSQVSRGGGRMPYWSSSGDTLFLVNQRSMFRVPLAVGENSVRAGTPERLFEYDLNTDSSYQEIDLDPSRTRFLGMIPEAANERREIGIVPGWAKSLGGKP